MQLYNENVCAEKKRYGMEKIMKRLKKCFALFLAICLIASPITASAATYKSFNSLKLDYKVGKFGAYGAGKNGYSFIHIRSIKGSKITYRFAKFAFIEEFQEVGIKEYGKIKTAMLTSATKYYIGNYRVFLKKINLALKKQKGDTSIHSQFVKNINWLKKVNKSEFERRNVGYYTYIKVNNGKVKIIVNKIQLTG